MNKESIIENLGLDPLIKPAVKILMDHGFKTFESCQGGKGHAFYEPTVRFEGSEFDLVRAFEICRCYGLTPVAARRVYVRCTVYKNDIEDIGESWERPFNEITFLICDI